MLIRPHHWWQLNSLPCTQESTVGPYPASWIYYRNHKYQSATRTTWTSRIHSLSHPISWSTILIIFCIERSRLPIRYIGAQFRTKILCAFLIVPTGARCPTCHHPSFDHANIVWSEHVMTFLVMQFSASSSHLPSLRFSSTACHPALSVHTKISHYGNRKQCSNMLQHIWNGLRSSWS